jgi:hypothetical protein
MLGRFKNNEQPWEPISEWGRSFQAYLETKNIVLSVKQEGPAIAKAPRKRKDAPRPCNRSQKPRPSTGNPVGRPKGLTFTSDRKCSKCDTCIRVDNTYGLCGVHAKPLRDLAWKTKKRAA